MPAFLPARHLRVHTVGLCVALQVLLGAGCSGDFYAELSEAELEELAAEPAELAAVEQALAKPVSAEDEGEGDDEELGGGRRKPQQGGPGPLGCTECVFRSSTCPTCSMLFRAPARGGTKILAIPSELQLDRITFFSSSPSTIRLEELSNLGVLRQTGVAGVDTFDLTSTLAGIEGPRVRMVEILASRLSASSESVLLSPVSTSRGVSIE